MEFSPLNPKKIPISIRQMQNGVWFWIQKKLIQEYSKEIGFSAMVVYCLLASMTDENQKCFPSQSYISKLLGCSRSTVNRAINILASNALIHIERKNRNHNVYYLLDIDSSNIKHQMLHQRNSDVQKQDTNNTNKQIINNDIVVSVLNKDAESENGVREELLARDIATALNDFKNIKTYHKYAHKYPEQFLRQILSDVKQTPEHKIRKSRAALFTYLLHFYENK